MLIDTWKDNNSQPPTRNDLERSAPRLQPARAWVWNPKFHLTTSGTWSHANVNFGRDKTEGLCWEAQCHRKLSDSGQCGVLAPIG
ncbi:hypothetical protein SCLCIDRAFT_832669 [Scleroderma citrinum Foug A]|uniref:Uncharacterized protein n=1 Tax=Scleroderma citrinum Foug A TaxID=1036808 RepID=A0A0C3ABK7_9AGAM|nr:hypothetical protein SCLCIDRAFT_832669 [Scleroderma citrinum Foug A]